MYISIYGIKDLDKIKGIYKTLEMYKKDAISILGNCNDFSFDDNFDL